jgi:soluble lytic murein transglycosylase-like protein
MVQQFREQEVQPSGQVPGYQNVQYSPDSFGASVGRALQNAGGTLQDIGQRQAELDSQKRANDALDVRNQASDSLRTVLFDPKTGIYAQQGKNAMDSSERLNQALGMIQKEYIDKVTDPGTQAALRKIWSREAESAKDSVAQHQMNELGKYKADTAKATMYGAMEDGYNYYNDDKSVDAAIKRTEEAIDVNSMGLPDESLKAAKQEARSNIRLAAISRWAAEDPSKALEYYQEHKDDLSGKDHVTATQFVRAAKANYDANLAATQIMKGGNPSLFQRMESAESGNDPNAESNKGAIGLMQILPGTAREVALRSGRPEIAALDDTALKAKLKSDPSLNRALGQQYMNEQLQRFGGDTEAALVAYNAGPEAADAFLKHNAGVPPGQRDYNVPGFKGVKTETEGYVQKILGTLPSRSTPVGQRMTPQNWSLKNFKPEDMMAPTANGQWVDANAALSMDKLADQMKQQFHGMEIKINEKPDPNGVTAGRRRGTADPADNPHVKHSQHLNGKAFDVQIQNWSTEQKAAFISYARQLGFAGFGFYGPKGHLHIDMGPERKWGPVPAWAVDALKTPVGKVPGQETTALPPGQQTTWQPGASDPSGYFIDAKESALKDWIDQAQGIEDPTTRERTIAILRSESAQIDQQRAQEAAMVKQAAWDHMVQGGSVKDLPPEMLSRIGPELESTLSSYETRRNKADQTTDWKFYDKAMNLSEEELSRADIFTEYRSHLGDAEFKQLEQLKREATKKLNGQEHDAGLLAGQRTRTQIVEDLRNQMDLKKDDPLLGKLNRALDVQIKGQSAILKRPLEATEIQDIADKLLIEDKYSNPVFNLSDPAQGKALDVTDPNKFIAASNWQEVQQDDQKTLIDYYERQFGSPPDEEAATDLYNRAMRVWLGGAPDGPEEEKTKLRQAIEASRGPVTDDYFEKVYGRYLLSYLGR